MMTEPKDGVLERWLWALPDAERSEIVSLFDERLDDVALARAEPSVPETDCFVPLPIVLAGTLIEADDEGAPGSWFHDFYEYAADQKYIFIGERHFHICTQAQSARAALQRGLIPANFSCAVAHRRCPMVLLLARHPGHSIQLSLIPARRLVRSGQATRTR